MYDYKIFYNNILIKEYLNTDIIFNKIKPIFMNTITNMDMANIIINNEYNTMFKFYGITTSFDVKQSLVLDEIYEDLMSINKELKHKLEIYIKESSKNDYNLILQTDNFDGIIRFQQADLSVPTYQNNVNFVCRT